MNIRELLTKWSFEVKDEPLKKVEAHLGQIKNNMDFLVGSQVVKGIIDIAEKFSRWAHELNSVSIASGVTVETIQSLTFAGAQFGATAEEITGAMTSLTLKINEAKMGFEGAQRAFSMAGFTGEQIRGWKNGNDALMALADRMHATVDPIRRQAMAAQLGISANSKLYATLSQGSGYFRDMAREAKELGVTMSDGQVKTLVDAQNAMTKFGMVLDSIGKKIAVMFAPSIKQAIDDMLLFYKANKDLISNNVTKWVDDFLYALGYLYGIMKFMVKAVMDFADAHPVLFRRITQVIAVVIAVGVALMALGVIIAPIVTAVTFLGSVFGILSSIVPIVGAVLAAVFSPVALWVAGIAALGLAIRTLWEVFVQGKSLKDTAFGKGISWLADAMGKVKDTFMEIGKVFASFGSVIGGFVKDSVKGVGEFLFPTDDGSTSADPKKKMNVNGMISNTMNAVSAANTAATPPASMSSIQQTQSSSSSADINAPITINISGANNPTDVAKHVKAGLADHLAKVVRETHRSLKSSESY